MVRDLSRGNRERPRIRVEHDPVIHDEEFGEENVELVDSEWADFEKFLRYIHTYIHNVHLLVYNDYLRSHIIFN